MSSKTKFFVDKSGRYYSIDEGAPIWVHSVNGRRSNIAYKARVPLSSDPASMTRGFMTVEGLAKVKEVPADDVPKEWLEWLEI